MSNYQLSKPEKGRQTSRKVRTKTGGERSRQRDRRETNTGSQHTVAVLVINAMNLYPVVSFNMSTILLQDSAPWGQFCKAP